MNDTIEVKLLKEIIKQKDKIIELQERIIQLENEKKSYPILNPPYIPNPLIVT